MFWLRRLFPENININFLRYKTFFVVISVAMVLMTFVGLIAKPLNFGIDFTGGMLFEVRFSKGIELSKVRKSLNQLSLGDVMLQSIGDGQNDVMIKVGLKDETKQKEYAAIIKNTLITTVDPNADFRKFEYIGAEVGKETIKKAILSLILTLFGIQIYIWYRFDLWYSIGVVVGLVHDLIMTIGVLILTQCEFNAASIAALLTVLGYSVNDTVVIYDRVRENMKKLAKLPHEEILNRSVNETLIRTILTVSTTLLAASALIIFGGESLYAFSLTVFIGILIGTYSSVFVSVPFLGFFFKKFGYKNTSHR